MRPEGATHPMVRNVVGSNGAPTSGPGQRFGNGGQPGNQGGPGQRFGNGGAGAPSGPETARPVRNDRPPGAQHPANQPSNQPSNSPQVMESRPRPSNQEPAAHTDQPVQQHNNTEARPESTRNERKTEQRNNERPARQSKKDTKKTDK